MTKEQKKAYLDHGASICPYCGRKNLDCDTPVLSDNSDEYECKTRCLNCRKEWVDVYGVVDVKD